MIRVKRPVGAIVRAEFTQEFEPSVSIDSLSQTYEKTMLTL